MHRDPKSVSTSSPTQLGDDELASVSGGLNPQPIPPGLPTLDVALDGAYGNPQPLRLGARAFMMRKLMS